MSSKESKGLTKNRIWKLLRLLFYSAFKYTRFLPKKKKKKTNTIRAN